MNVHSLPAPTNAPNDGLVGLLRDLLGRAESGELRSFIGTGYLASGVRITAWGDHHANLYEMLGSLSWLQAEYLHRHAGGLE